MAYATYTTKALVCGSKDSYTSDRSYLLFTEDLGMLWASARSVRMEKSKQRYALQDFSILRVSLVKGKTGWKIGSAEALGNPFLAAVTRVHRTAVTQLVRQLRRYIHGEGEMTSIFTDITATLQQLPEYDENDLVPVTEVFLLRLLAILGYVRQTEMVKPLLQAADTVDAFSYYDDEIAAAIRQSITAAEQVSHL